MSGFGSFLRGVGKVAIGSGLVFAGVGHLTFVREEFQAQVPDWFPVDPDQVVLGSGVVEIALGAAHLLIWKQPARAKLGALSAAFFTVIFPGNISQLTEHKDGFGLDTDQKRLIRLFFQPLLVAGALGAGDTRRTLGHKH